MDPCSQRGNIVVPSATDDSLVGDHLTMQARKISVIESYDSPLLRDGESKHIRVGNTLIPLACFLHGQNVVPELTEFLDDRITEILVRVKLRHWHFTPGDKRGVA